MTSSSLDLKLLTDTSDQQYYDQEMTGNLDSKIVHMIPMYKSKWWEM
jgi:hypothetical protein